MTFPREMRGASVVRVVGQPIAIALILALAARAFIHIYTIPSESMAPTLQVGDHIVVTPYRAAPAQGDVIVFRAQSGDELLVKRIIARPGDLVESRQGAVMIGGHALAEPYLRDRAHSGAIPPQIVPPDCYFVMGDNRAHSVDSRVWGAVPRPRIIGRARLILWSSQASGEGATGGRGAGATLRLFRPIE